MIFGINKSVKSFIGCWRVFAWCDTVIHQGTKLILELWLLKRCNLEDLDEMCLDAFYKFFSESLSGVEKMLKRSRVILLLLVDFKKNSL